MAVLDRENRYSDAQAVTDSAVSTDVIDHESDRDLGIGEPLAVLINTDVVADDGDGNETYDVDLETDALVAFGSPVVIGTVNIPRGTVAGTQFVIPVPPDETFERFSRLNIRTGGATPSVTLTAHLVPQEHVPNFVARPSGFQVT